MKRSIVTAMAILVVGIVPGLIQRHQLNKLRQEHDKLLTEAVKSGWLDAQEAGWMRTKALRGDGREEAAAAVREASGITNELKILWQRGGGESSPLLKSRLQSVNPDALEEIIIELDRNREIPDEVKRGLIVSALVRWAEVSPDSALSWLRAQSTARSDAVSEEARRAVICGTAKHDPERAFKLTGELFLEDESAAIRAIVAGCHESPESRDEFLASLREYLSAIPDEEKREKLGDAAFDSLARHLGKTSFEESIAWVDRAGLSAVEKGQFASGLSYFGTKENTGRWIDWLSDNAADESVAGPVYGLMSEWTQKDHQSAGTWLLSAKDGPAKTTAVKAYATAVAQFEPAVAAQWAMTLPAGPERDSTLRAVYQHWPSSDPEGAKAFAREHGLK